MDSPPSSPNLLVPVYLTFEEALEAFRLDQFVEDRLLAFRREGNLLVRPLDTALQPGLLCRVGNVHELDAERRAVGALEDRENFVERAHLEAEHVVDEDRPVHVLRAETVAFGLQFGIALLFAKLQGIEVGDQMAPDPVGPDQHQCTHGVERCAAQLLLAG